MRKLTYLFISIAITSLTVAHAAKPLTFSLNRLDGDKSFPVTEKSWGDKYLLIAVGYTTCPNICPTTLLDMREAIKHIDEIAPESGKKIQPLFITIDPTSDKLVNITQYAAHFSPKIIGLRTDDYGKLNDVVEQLGASYGYLFKGKYISPPGLPKGYTVMHSTFTYLYSPDGQLVDGYPYNMDGQTLAENILKNMAK